MGTDTQIAISVLKAHNMFEEAEILAGATEKCSCVQCQVNVLTSPYEENQAIEQELATLRKEHQDLLALVERMLEIRRTAKEGSALEVFDALAQLGEVFNQADAFIKKAKGDK